jgi:hypothetical protein
MRSHEHALISLGYAGGLAWLAGRGLGDAWLYGAALLGGEILDVLDHPLYHLVYARNEAHVAEARRVLAAHGVRAAWAYLNQVEAQRLFQGLVLHNVYALAVVAAACLIVGLWTPVGVYVPVGLGALLLHMLSDVIGDFAVLGHADNWLWVVRREELEAWARRGARLVGVVETGALLVLGALALVSMRAIWQLRFPLAQDGLLALARDPQAWQLWLAYGPLALLALYFGWLVLMCVASVHKYGLETGRAGKLRFNLGSMRLLFDWLRGRVPRNRATFERVVLRMQADRAVWTVVLALLVSGLLLIFGAPAGTSDRLLVLIPLVLALLFGTFLGTTIGEWGGVLGVMLAWLGNLAAARLGLLAFWPLERAYWLFAAALGAWALGLLGGVLLAGRRRMSLMTFCVELRPHANGSIDDAWQHRALELIRASLKDGYAAMHARLFGQLGAPHFSTETPANTLLLPGRGRPLLGEDHLHWVAGDAYAPLLREMAYVLCANRLTAGNPSAGVHGLLPVLPRYRFSAVDDAAGEMSWSHGVFHWRTQRASAPEGLVLPGAGLWDLPDQVRPQMLVLTKTWGEFMDHMVTRHSEIRTDICVFPAAAEPTALTMCGVAREITSTVEFVSVETEAYVAAVLEAIQNHCARDPFIALERVDVLRWYYPRQSLYDQELAGLLAEAAVLPASGGTAASETLRTSRAALGLLGGPHTLTSVTADWGKRLVVVFLEGAAGVLISAWLPQNFLQILIGWLAPWFAGGTP